MALILAAAMLLGCAPAETAAEPVDEMAVQIGEYTITSKTGEVVTFLCIADNITGESESMTYPVDEGIEDGGAAVMSFAIPANEDGHHRLTLRFTFGDEGSCTVKSFETLSVEEATIELLNPDTAADAAPIRFAVGG